jgi:hypothetical protein
MKRFWEEHESVRRVVEELRWQTKMYGLEQIIRNPQELYDLTGRIDKRAWTDSLKSAKYLEETCIFLGRDVLSRTESMGRIDVCALRDDFGYWDAAERFSQQIKKGFALDGFKGLNQQMLPDFRKTAMLEETVLARMATEISALGTQILRPSDLIADVAGGIAAAAKSYSLPDTVILSTMGLSTAFEDFTQGQLQKMLRETKLIASKRAGVLGLMGDVYRNCGAVIELELSHAQKLQDSQESKFGPNLFRAINRKARPFYRKETSIDVPKFISNEEEFQISALGRRIVRLVVKINEYERRKGRSDIFNFTNSNFEAGWLVPTVIIEDELTFSQIITNLYFLLYEGSGGSSKDNRLVHLVGETEKDEFLEPLWTLKHFRLEDSHDIEHGEETDIRDKYIKIGNAYKKLIFRVMAETRDDLRRVQLHLYRNLVAMLERIHKKQIENDDDN